MQELRADPVVETNAASDVLNVGVGCFAEVGDLVDEADLDREKGIRRIFDQLGRTAARHEDG